MWGLNYIEVFVFEYQYWAFYRVLMVHITQTNMNRRTELTEYLWNSDFHLQIKFYLSNVLGYKLWNQ